MRLVHVPDILHVSMHALLNGYQKMFIVFFVDRDWAPAELLVSVC